MIEKCSDIKEIVDRTIVASEYKRGTYILNIVGGEAMGMHYTSSGFVPDKIYFYKFKKNNGDEYLIYSNIQQPNSYQIADILKHIYKDQLLKDKDAFDNFVRALTTANKKFNWVHERISEQSDLFIQSAIFTSDISSLICNERAIETLKNLCFGLFYASFLPQVSTDLINISHPPNKNQDLELFETFFMCLLGHNNNNKNKALSNFSDLPTKTSEIFLAELINCSEKELTDSYIYKNGIPETHFSALLSFVSIWNLNVIKTKPIYFNRICKRNLKENQLLKDIILSRLMNNDLQSIETIAGCFKSSILDIQGFLNNNKENEAIIKYQNNEISIQTLLKTIKSNGKMEYQITLEKTKDIKLIIEMTIKYLSVLICVDILLRLRLRKKTNFKDNLIKASMIANESLPLMQEFASKIDHPESLTFKSISVLFEKFESLLYNAQLHNAFNDKENPFFFIFNICVQCFENKKLFFDCFVEYYQKYKSENDFVKAAKKDKTVFAAANMVKYLFEKKVYDPRNYLLSTSIETLNNEFEKEEKNLTAK